MLKSLHTVIQVKDKRRKKGYRVEIVTAHSKDELLKKVKKHKNIIGDRILIQELDYVHSTELGGNHYITEFCYL